MKRVYQFVIVLLLLNSPLSAQPELEVFRLGDFLWFVENYHPVAAQGSLTLQEGQSTIRQARGKFDPYLYGNLDEKQFEKKDYYSILNSGLKIPTWYGVDFNAGFDRTSGQFLNMENSLPDNGLWQVGISVPIGKGLVIDKRRAELKKARVFSQSTLAEQQKILNDLYFDAITHYWKWTDAWNQYQIYAEALVLTQTRLDAVKKSFEQGSKPAIDTLEATIQLQNRQISLKNSLLAYQKSTLALSNFMWFENNTPLVITDSLVPPLLESENIGNVVAQDTLEFLLTALQSTHPDMQLYNYKIASINIDRQLKVEAFKPKIDLKYNFLTAPVGSETINNFSSADYKWGAKFSFPLFLRKERGSLQLTKLKIQDATLARQQKLLELQNKLRAYYTEQVNLNGQVSLIKSTVNNYKRLVEAEKQKFDIGESSLFLVNSRESKFIASRLKQVKLTSKYKIASSGINWATGTLGTANE